MKKFIIGEFDVKETKSERLNLLLQPLLKDYASKVATMERTSLNEYICKCIEKDVSQKLDKIIQWYQVFGEQECLK